MATELNLSKLLLTVFDKCNYSVLGSVWLPRHWGRGPLLDPMVALGPLGAIERGIVCLWGYVREILYLRGASERGTVFVGVRSRGTVPPLGQVGGVLCLWGYVREVPYLPGASERGILWDLFQGNRVSVE